MRHIRAVRFGRLLPLIAACAALGYLGLGSPAHVLAASFTVDSTVDAVDANPGDAFCATASGECTLRAAIQESNALPGADLITLPAGTYLLDIQGGFGEETAASGDLDITDDVEIVGAGAGDTIIDAGRFTTHDLVDVAFHIHSGDRVMIAGVTVENAGHILALGGGVLNQGTLTLTRSVLRDNLARRGGGIYNRGGVLTVNDSAFIGNGGLDGTSAGGAILSELGGTLTLNDVEFIDNGISGLVGGAIASVSPATLNRVTVRNNRVGLGFAGGIYNGDLMTVTDSTISGNTPGPGGQGGGIFNGSNGLLTVTNSTISGNSASGIHNEGNATLTNVTVTGTTAALGGIYHDTLGLARNLTIRNTVVAGNSGGDCGGPSVSEIVSGGHNLSSDATCPFTAPGDLQSADPRLGPLADNGGPTQTQALLPGSPAIDAGGNAACPATDQRGFSRPFDGNGDGQAVCDIGAYEAHRCVADVNDDGIVDASDVKLVARAMHAKPGSERWNGAADVNGDSEVDGADLHAVLKARKEGACP